MAIKKQDILPVSEFLKIRHQKLQEILEIKKQRHVKVGPYISFYFESYDTIWWQIHEMLRIENGGEKQVQEELLAYEPLIPKKLPDGGQELVATLMIEIEDLALRYQMLRLLNEIESSIFLQFANEKIQAKPEMDLERSQDGKTSAVHFVRFQLSFKQWEIFQKMEDAVALIIEHPHYNYFCTLLKKTVDSLIYIL